MLGFSHQAVAESQTVKCDSYSRMVYNFGQLRDSGVSFSEATNRLRNLLDSGKVDKKSYKAGLDLLHSVYSDLSKSSPEQLRDDLYYQCMKRG